MHDRTINPSDCLAFIQAVLVKLGTPSDQARRWAELAVETSLLGIDSHGIRMFDRYVRFARGGGVDMDAEPEIISDSGSCLSMDARAGWGQLAADRAADLATERAREHGIACVVMRNCNHVGACGLYVLKAARSDCVGICGCVSRAAVAPWGGKEPLVGLNPIAIAAPASGQPPFLLDMSTTVTAMGRVRKVGEQTGQIPSGWAMDAEGNPTTDPEAAIHGTLLPIGDYKGYGLALAIEILCVMLGGGAMPWDVKSWILQTAEPMGASFTMIAIDIRRFQDVDGFRQRMSEWFTRLTGAETREGFNQINYPGQREGQAFALRVKQGIPVDDRTVEMFTALADEFGVDQVRIQEDS